MYTKKFKSNTYFGLGAALSIFWNMAFAPCAPAGLASKEKNPDFENTHHWIQERRYSLLFFFQKWKNSYTFSLKIKQSSKLC